MVNRNMFSRKMMSRKMIITEVILILLIVIMIYILYPKIDYSISGEVVRFTSENSDLMIFSENIDFSNPKYVNFENNKAIVKLEPGKYYLKAANNFVKGFVKVIEINSKVGLGINRDESDEVEIENIGNVKINITKTEEGITVGYIQLSPSDSEEIEDDGLYTGREEDGK